MILYLANAKDFKGIFFDGSLVLTGSDRPSESTPFKLVVFFFLDSSLTTQILSCRKAGISQRNVEHTLEPDAKSAKSTPSFCCFQPFLAFLPFFSASEANAGLFFCKDDSFKCSGTLLP